LNRNPDQKSSKSEKYSSYRRNKLKNSTSVITVRIDEELNYSIEKTRTKLGVSKADLIRNYLEMSRYIIKQKISIQSLNDRDLIIIKRSYLRKLMENWDEEEQINLGEKLARFINDCARINGKLDDMDYKLEMCENLGFFRKFMDDEKYLLIDKKFGPLKFVEAFIWTIFNKGVFNPDWISSKIDTQSKIRTAYEKQVHPVERSSSHFSYEFAKIVEEETE